MTQRAHLLLWPASWIVENEPTRLAVELLLFEQFGNSHSSDRLPGGMSEQKSETLLLKRRYTKFVGDVHEAFDVVPGDRTFQTNDVSNTLLRKPKVRLTAGKRT